MTNLNKSGRKLFSTKLVDRLAEVQGSPEPYPLELQNVMIELLALLHLPQFQPYEKESLKETMSLLHKGLVKKRKQQANTYQKVYLQIIRTAFNRIEPILLIELVFDWVKSSSIKSVGDSIIVDSMLTPEIMNSLLNILIDRCGSEHYAELVIRVQSLCDDFKSMPKDQQLSNSQRLLKLSISSLAQTSSGLYYVCMLSVWEYLIELGAVSLGFEEMLKLVLNDDIDKTIIDEYEKVLRRILKASLQDRPVLIIGFTSLLFQTIKSQVEDAAGLEKQPTLLSRMINLLSFLLVFLRDCVGKCESYWWKQVFDAQDLTVTIKSWILQQISICKTSFPSSLILMHNLLVSCEILMPRSVDLKELGTEIISNSEVDIWKLLEMVSRLVTSPNSLKNECIDFVKQIQPLYKDRISKLAISQTSKKTIKEIFMVWQYTLQKALSDSWSQECVSLLHSIISSGGVEFEEIKDLFVESYRLYLIQAKRTCDDLKQFYRNQLSQLNLHLATMSTTSVLSVGHEILFLMTDSLISVMRPSDINNETASFYLESFQKITAPFLSFGSSYRLQDHAALTLGRISGLSRVGAFRGQLLRELVDQALHIEEPARRRGYILGMAQVFVATGNLSNSTNDAGLDSGTIVGMLMSIARNMQTAEVKSESFLNSPMTSQSAALCGLAIIVREGSALLSPQLINELLYFSWEMHIASSGGAIQTTRHMGWTSLFGALLEVLGPDLRNTENRWRSFFQLQNGCLLEDAMNTVDLHLPALKTSLQLLLTTQEIPSSVEVLFILLKCVLSGNDSLFDEKYLAESPLTVAVSVIRWLYEFNPSTGPAILRVFGHDLIRMISVFEDGTTAASIEHACRDVRVLLTSIFSSTILIRECRKMWLDMIRATIPSIMNGAYSAKRTVVENSESFPPILRVGSVRFIIDLFVGWFVEQEKIQSQQLQRLMDQFSIEDGCSFSSSLSSELMRLAMALVVAASNNHSPRDIELKIIGIDLLAAFLRHLASLSEESSASPFNSGRQRRLNDGPSKMASIVGQFHSQIVTIFNSACMEGESVVSGETATAVLKSHAFETFLLAFADSIAANNVDTIALFTSSKMERLLKRSVDALTTWLPEKMSCLLEWYCGVKIAHGWARLAIAGYKNCPDQVKNLLFSGKITDELLKLLVLMPKGLFLLESQPLSRNDALYPVIQDSKC